MPLSKVAMSVSLFTMGGAWLLQDDLKARLKNFFSNRVALILASVYLLHLLGLLWTSNFTYGLHDIKTKLPLLLFPFMLSTGPRLTGKHIRQIFEVFALAVCISVACGLLVYAGVIKKEIHDIRDISLFVSHIRLALMICIATVIHFIYMRKSNPLVITYRILSMILMLFFLRVTGSVTGFSILFILMIAYLFRLIASRSWKWLAASLIIMFGLVIVGVSLVSKEVRHYYSFTEEDIRDLEPYTIKGNPYLHDLNNDDHEEGRRVYIYISWPELEEAWINRSSIDFKGKDQRGQMIQFTLVRYMTALGLRKDAEGFDKLTDQDIKNIEQGVSNPHYANYGIRSRIHQVIWEIDHYIKGNDSNGHSVAMRLEFWKNGIALVEQDLFTGVGTGDVQDEMNKMYEARHSSLLERWRLRPHNQYITFTVTFGTAGLLLFLISLCYPLVIRSNRTFLYITFVIVLGVSMLTEDTLESQAGVTLFAFFNSFLLFQFNRQTETDNFEA
jgi:hypothetical protein